MAAALSSSADARSQIALYQVAQAKTAASGKISIADKARATAEDFEAIFLNTMFSQMFTGIDGDGPFGGTQGVGVWRSFLTQEYAKSFAQKGGIGLADHVYRSLMGQQEAVARQSVQGAYERMTK